MMMMMMMMVVVVVITPALVRRQRQAAALLPSPGERLLDTSKYQLIMYHIFIHQMGMLTALWI